MAPSRKQISRLVVRLNSPSQGVAKRAATDLDAMLYPQYAEARGVPVAMTLEQSLAVDERHFSQLRGSDTVLPLLETLKTGTDFARNYAAGALSSIGDKRAIPYLLDALSDPSPIVRSGAARSFRWLNDPRAISQLVWLLADPDVEVVESAAIVLGIMRAAESVEPLIELTSHMDWRRRACAFEALGDILDPRALPLLRDALNDRHKRVRKAAKSALARFDLVRREEAQPCREPERPASKIQVIHLGRSLGYD